MGVYYQAKGAIFVAVKCKKTHRFKGFLSAQTKEEIILKLQTIQEKNLVRDGNIFKNTTGIIRTKI